MDAFSVMSMLSFQPFYPWTSMCTRDSWSNKSQWARHPVRQQAPPCWLAVMARHGRTQQIWRENLHNSRFISRAAAVEAVFCIIWGLWLFILAALIQVSIIWIQFYNYYLNKPDCQMIHFISPYHDIIYDVFWFIFNLKVTFYFIFLTQPILRKNNFKYFK